MRVQKLLLPGPLPELTGVQEFYFWHRLESYLRFYEWLVRNGRIEEGVAP